MNPPIKEETIQNFKNSAQDFRSNASELAHEAKGDLRDAANQAGRKVRGYIDAANDEISQATDTVTKEIRSNPIQSSLIALGAGFILGALFRR